MQNQTNYCITDLNDDATVFSRSFYIGLDGVDANPYDRLPITMNFFNCSKTEIKVPEISLNY